MPRGNDTGQTVPQGAGREKQRRHKKLSTVGVKPKAKTGRPGRYAKSGRPTVMTDVVIQKLETAFSMDCTVDEACLFAGISPTTFHLYCSRTPGFTDRLNLLRHKPVLKARTTVLKALDQTRDAQWYLERKCKGEFSQRTETTGPGGGPIETLARDEMSDAELKSVLREIIKDDAALAGDLLGLDSLPGVHRVPVVDLTIPKKRGPRGPYKKHDSENISDGE